MSWNLNLAVLRDLSMDALTLTGPVQSFDEAQAEFGLQAAIDGDRLVVLDPLMEAKDLAARTGAQLFSVMLGGTADVYAIEAVGAVNRLHVLMSGEVTEDVGVPLPEESVLAEHEFPEDGHLAVFELLLGKPFSALFEMEFQAVDGTLL